MPTPIIDTINDARAVVGFVSEHLKLVEALAERLPPDLTVDVSERDFPDTFLIRGTGASCGNPGLDPPNPEGNECHWEERRYNLTAVSGADLKNLTDRALHCCAALERVLGQSPPPIR